MKTLKEVTKGDVTVPLYDSEAYAQLKRARDKGEEATVAPLVSIVINYGGSYSKCLEKILMRNRAPLFLCPVVEILVSNV